MNFHLLRLTAIQALRTLRSRNLRWLAYIVSHAFLREPRFTASPISPGHPLESLISVDYIAPDQPIKWLDPVSLILADGKMRRMPYGTVGDAWRQSLTARLSGNGAAQTTETAAVRVILPHLLLQSVNITALLTYPTGRLLPECIHVTWIYHQ